MITEPTKELIPIQEVEIKGRLISVVNARELHNFLEVKTEFKDWIRRRIERYGFIDGLDYSSILSGSAELDININQRKDYLLTISMAKELCMVEDNQKGKEARLYFIQKEEEARKLKEVITKPLSQLEIMKMSLAVLEEQEKRISQVENKVLAIEENQKQAEQHLLALPEPTVAPKTRTVRSLVTEVVRDYVVRHNMGKHGYSIAFSKLYREFKYRYSFDALARARNSKKSPLEIIEENGLIDDLYSLARELFSK